MEKKFSKTAFSLLELSVSVLIIAILIGVILTAENLTNKAKIATAQSLTKSSPIPDIEGLALWLETTMPQSFEDISADDGKAIFTWNDLSADKVDVKAGTAPTYIVNGINELPVLRFNGSSQYLKYNGSFLANNDFTIFIVEKRSSANRAYILGSDALSGQGFAYGYTDANHTVSITNGISGSASLSSGSAITPRIHSFLFQTLNKYFYVNGVLLSSSSNSAVIGNTNAYIGRNANLYFSGDIGEIIIFTKDLTAKQRLDVEEYLGKKWGITLATVS